MLQTGILIEGKEWTELRVVACRVGKMDPDVASSFAPELRAKIKRAERGRRRGNSSFPLEKSFVRERG